MSIPALQRQVIDLGCPVHIIHNMARKALVRICIDVAHQDIFNIREERLKSFCECVGQEYRNVSGHSNIRWLSMLPALERKCMCH